MSSSPGLPKLSSTGLASWSRAKTRTGPSAATRSRSGLPRHVSEAGDRSWIVDPVVGTPDGDERLTQIAQGGLTRVFNVPFGYQHAYEPTTVLQLAEGVAAKGVVVDAPFRLLGQLDFG